MAPALIVLGFIMLIWATAKVTHNIATKLRKDGDDGDDSDDSENGDDGDVGDAVV